MRLWPVAVLVSVLAIAIQAQQTAVSETVEVRLIEIDAVVTDRDGNPVTALTADDFELFENGKRQPITNFSEYHQSVERRPAPAAKVTEEGPTAGAAAAPQRTIVLFIDALALRGPERLKLFDNLRSLVARTMREGDRAELLTWNDNGGLRATTPLTTDRKVIEAAITFARDNANVDAAGPTAQEYAAFFGNAPGNNAASERYAAERELALMRRKTAAIQRIVSALAQPAGRNIFVYVSESFPLVAGKRAATPRRAVATMNSQRDMTLRVGYTTRHMLDAVINTANANGVSFYAVRPERPWTSPVGSPGDDAEVVDNPNAGLEVIADQIVLQNEIESLSLVAEETGGTFGVGPQAVEEIVERIVRDVSSYYTLAYRARSDGSDRTRRVEVRAKNREHRVRTRRTIVEKSDRTRARDVLVSRLFENGAIGEIPFEVTIGSPAKAGRNRIQTPVELSIAAERLRFEPEGNELAAKFTVLTVAGTALHTTGAISEQTKRITAPAGTTPQGAIRFSFVIFHEDQTAKVAIAVFDEKSGLAGTRSIILDVWNEALDRAQREKKPIVVFERPQRCTGRCAAFEGHLKHVAVQRRLEELVFITRPAPEPALALHDRRGNLVTRIAGLPVDVNALAVALHGIISVKPRLERAAVLTETIGPNEGDLERAAALIILGRAAEARVAVDRASQHDRPITREYAVVVRAMLDVSEGKRAEALASLTRLTAEASSPEIAATAWIGIASIHRGIAQFEDAIRAYTKATEIAEPGSATHTSASAALLELRASGASPGPIRVMPPHEQIISGRRTIRTTVSSAEVARVVFSLDGEQKAIVDRPPFSTLIDFGRIPQPRTIRAVAHDASGREIGRHELTVNHAGEMFWIRLIEPREGLAGGKVRVTTTLRVPAGRKVKRVAISWNDVERAVLTTEPWQTDVDIPPNELGVLRASAEIDDGRTAEDAVLLNTTGHVERADVPLVEIPVTITESSGTPSRITVSDVAVRDGGKSRPIESVTSGADAPLTVGMVLDTSGSMYRRILDVQEAALRFLETALDPNDRAFLITFDSHALLRQTPTADREALRKQIMAIRTSGMTALHDAMILGLLQFEGIKGRRAMIVFTDGADTASRYQARDVEDLARRSNIPIYVIAAKPAPRARPMSMAPLPPRTRTNEPPGGSFRPVSAPSAISAQWLVQLIQVTRATGGSTHQLDDLRKLSATYEKIAVALRAQSLIVIRTDAGRSEGDWRRIEVAVAGKNRDVRAPAGYYAPW